MRGLRTSVAVVSAAVLGGVGLLALGGATAVNAGADTTDVIFTADGTFTVPAGVDCIEVDIDGASGGAGAADTGGGGAGGYGGEIRMALAVTPGSTFGVMVGAAGTDGASVGEAGGGGGASAVLLDGTPLAIAGGGGGGGAAQGTNGGGDGGNGGETAGNGVDGSGTATGGGGGSGAPGAAGTNEGAGSAPTAGAAEPPDGGDGGGGNYGGGGGGGGSFGGGGGGSSETASGAGGGGGGSGVNEPLAGSSGHWSFNDGIHSGAGEVTFSYGPSLDCLTAPLTVKKVAVGPVAPGTTVTEHLQCTDPVVTKPVGSSESTSSRDFVFTVDADGVAQPAAGYRVGFIEPTDCSVTETVTGGAATVSYTCTGEYIPIPTDATATDWAGAQIVLRELPPICGSAGPSASPISMTVNVPYQRATITVTNTYEPTFTG